MNLPKNFNRKHDKRGGAAAVLAFLVRHGEKCLAGVLIVAAIGFASQTLWYQPVSWTASELEELSDNTVKAIENSKHALVDSKITPFNYAAYAEQIKAPLPSDLYRSDIALKPSIYPDPLPRSGFEVLTAVALRGEAVRRTGAVQEPSPDQWQPPPVPETQHSPHATAIWVNVYGAIPLWQQWDIYNHVFDSIATESNRPQYVYYELERAEVKPKEELVWQPMSVYPEGEVKINYELDAYSDCLPERLIPLGPPGAAQEQYAESVLLFSDCKVEPAKTYAYRIRLYLVNPNFNLQETVVAEGVDTKSELIRSDWSLFARVYVPDRTLVQIQSVSPTDPTVFPRQTAPLRAVSGTVTLNYFDVELGQSLPSVEKRDVRRGMLGNMSKEEANKEINRVKSPDEVVNVNYPDSGLRSGVCVLDFIGGRKLQKTPSREAQISPELFAPGKALLLMPDGTLQVTSTVP